MTLLTKINRIPPTSSRKAVSPVNGGYTHWIWRDTGVRRANRWTPKLLVGFEMSAPAEKMPDDGGTYPAGKWATTYPTGKRQLIWD